jgi:hypothetical protein
MVLGSVHDRGLEGRWGEGLALLAAAPGFAAAAVLALVLVSERFGWQPHLGPLTDLVAWLAMSSPALVLLGMLTLIGGVLLAGRTPGRASHKWAILIVGTLAWAAATYWLSVPGLIDLP